MTRGFTLLETLIALVIASVTALVLLQSILAIARGTAGVDAALAGALESEFSRAAAADALAASVADYLDAPGVFTGTARSLSGATRRPLFAPHGTPAGFSMELQESAGGTVLVHVEGEESVAVMRFDVPDAEFRYAHRPVEALYAGDPPVASDVWPPDRRFDDTNVYFRPPPALVTVVDGEGNTLWAVASDGWTEAPMRGRDLEDIL